MPTLWQDQVASHSWFVAVYSIMVADLIEWKGDRGRLLTYAVLHDLGEVVTGDICWPIKPNIIDSEREGDYVINKLSQVAPGVMRIADAAQSTAVKQIVKVADRLDALFYCAGETGFGNGAMGQRMGSLTDQAWRAWMELPDLPKEDKVLLWRRAVIPSIAAHQDPRHYDIEVPE